MSRTTERFNELSDEGKQSCYKTLEMVKESGECRPDEWEHIVDFYWYQENALPTDWFNYFDY